MSKGKPYRTVEIDGWEVLVGRGAADNDALTFTVADPADLWMHAADAPGSHVVVRNPTGAEVPATVVRQAAELAAYYSQARGARKAKVDYCRVADVDKPRRAPAGEVELGRYRTVQVPPRRPEPNQR